MTSRIRLRRQSATWRNGRSAPCDDTSNTYCPDTNASASSRASSAREAVALKRMSDELKARAARLTAAFDELANNLRAA